MRLCAGRTHRLSWASGRGKDAFGLDATQRCGAPAGRQPVPGRHMVWRFAADTNDLGRSDHPAGGYRRSPSSRAPPGHPSRLPHTRWVCRTQRLLVTGQPRSVLPELADDCELWRCPSIQVETVGRHRLLTGCGSWTQQHPAVAVQEVQIRAARFCWNGTEAASDGCRSSAVMAWRGRRVAARYGLQPFRWRPRP